MKQRLTTLIAVLCACVSTLMAASPIDGMLERIDPGAARKFAVSIKPQGDTNYFEIYQAGKKVGIRANNYINAAVGVNWYLKHHAGIHISWNSPKAKLPDVLPAVTATERRESQLPLCYDFNYCTYSYTMPFWDWERWEQELDWMAMHGVNIPLAAVGQECVWRGMLTRLGYNKDEINEFISGPAFMAWWAMNNLEGWGGPNPDSWYERQEELQKRILKRMAEYGMHPVLPGYSGMMPHNADAKLGLNINKSAELWNGYVRPAFLQPTDPRFDEIAALYYDEQRRLFGTSDYYSMDPFHEAELADDFDFAAGGQAIMAAMKRVNPRAVWVVQGWSENPREDMIDGLNAGDLLILDLFSECRPMWGIPSISQRKEGYKQHDWVMCMLENFGGNVGLHGRMDQLLENFYAAKGNPLARHLRGIGYTQEGSLNNPVMFELMSELPWRPDRFGKEDWIGDYCHARYGVRDPQIEKAWSILINSIYNCPRGNNQQGPHESIFCCRPNLDNFQASSWSKMQNYYDPADTRQAAIELLKVADKYRGNNNYEYDLVDIVRQAIADQARLTYQHAIADYKAFNHEGFAANSARFMRMLDLQDRLLATRPEFKVGTWIAYALNAGATEAEKALYEWNARVQVTTWGNRVCADDGGLRDYAHKEWSGMLRDFYRPRWQAFWATLQNELDTRQKAQPLDYYAIEEPWTLARNPYPTEAEGDPVEVAQAVAQEILY